MTLGRWSVFVGASQSKLVDLIIRNTLNVCLVAGVVCLLAADGLVLLIIGAAFSVIGLLLTAWLLQREVRRKNGLLNIYVGAKLLLLIAAGAGYQARRPDDLGWIWASVGLGVLGILSEPTVRLLLARRSRWPSSCPGCRSCRSRPFRPAESPRFRWPRPRSPGCSRRSASRGGCCWCWSGSAWCRCCCWSGTRCGPM